MRCHGWLMRVSLDPPSPKLELELASFLPSFLRPLPSKLTLPFVPLLFCRFQSVPEGSMNLIETSIPLLPRKKIARYPASFSLLPPLLINKARTRTHTQNLDTPFPISPSNPINNDITSTISRPSLPLELDLLLFKPRYRRSSSRSLTWVEPSAGARISLRRNGGRRVRMAASISCRFSVNLNPPCSEGKWTRRTKCFKHK